MDEDAIADAHRQLWAAVLLQALEDIVAGKDAPPGARRDLAIQARLWVASDEDAICSFVFVCGVLDLDPGLMRTRIRDRAATMNLEQLRQLWQREPGRQLEALTDDDEGAEAAA